MAIYIPNVRKANAKLVVKEVNFYGKRWAIQDNADGYSSINVVVAQPPSEIKQYLEGDDSVTIYPVASSISTLCDYALASFPNIIAIYLFSTSLVTITDNFSYLSSLEKIYVPSDLLESYQTTYSDIASLFDTIVEDYTLTIPYVGDSTLTSEYVDSVIAMLSSGEKSAITKVVIPTDFTQSSADSIAWTYDFSALPNLNNNIWYGMTQYDFSVLTISGSGTLTSEIVEEQLARAGDKKNLITKIVIPNTYSFTNTSDTGLLDNVINEYLPNFETIDYDLYATVGYRRTDIPLRNLLININNVKVKEIIARKTGIRNNNGSKTYAGLGNYTTLNSENNILEKVTIYENPVDLESKFCVNAPYLKIVDASRLTKIEGYMSYGSDTQCFYNCQSLEKVYFNGLTTVPPLYGNNTYYIFNQHANNFKIYVSYSLLVNFIEGTNWSNFAQYYIGVLDYTDTIPTFSGYTATWYEDEDCTTTIDTSDFVSGTRYYCKLA